MFDFDERVKEMDRQFNRSVSRMYVFGCASAVFWVALIAAAVIGVALILRELL